MAFIVDLYSKTFKIAWNNLVVIGLQSLLTLTSSKHVLLENIGVNRLSFFYSPTKMNMKSNHYPHWNECQIWNCLSQEDMSYSLKVSLSYIIDMKGHLHQRLFSLKASIMMGVFQIWRSHPAAASDV